MNDKPITLLLLVALLCSFVNSCSSDQPTGNNSRPPAIHGRVVDATGKPVANAGVGLIFSFVETVADSLEPGIPMLMGPNPAFDREEFRFIVGTMKYSQITIQFLRADTRELVKTVVDVQRDSGIYEFFSPLIHLPNQAYIIRYINETDTVERLLIVNQYFYSNVAPITTTDSEGRFTVDYSSLPIGRTFLSTDDRGSSSGKWYAISDSIQLAISRPETPMNRHIWSLKVDSTAVVDSTLRLP
jgi:hypothetical protein